MAGQRKTEVMLSFHVARGASYYFWQVCRLARMRARFLFRCMRVCARAQLPPLLAVSLRWHTLRELGPGADALMTMLAMPGVPCTSVHGVTCVLCLRTGARALSFRGPLCVYSVDTV